MAIKIGWGEFIAAFEHFPEVGFVEQDLDPVPISDDPVEEG
jgi:hypothetical protein